MNCKLGIAAVFFLGAAFSTCAQVNGVKVRVPFEFEVAGETLLPPGEYVAWLEHDEFFLRGAGGKTVAMVSKNRIIPDGGKFGTLVFNCYEKRCFLSQLWLPDAEQAAILLPSKSEKEAARKVNRQQFALLGEVNQRATTSARGSQN